MSYTVFLLVASLVGYALTGLVPSSSDRSQADEMAELQMDEDAEAGPNSEA